MELAQPLPQPRCYSQRSKVTKSHPHGSKVAQPRPLLNEAVGAAPAQPDVPGAVGGRVQPARHRRAAAVQRAQGQTARGESTGDTGHWTHRALGTLGTGDTGHWTHA